MRWERNCATRFVRMLARHSHGGRAMRSLALVSLWAACTTGGTGPSGPGSADPGGEISGDDLGGAIGSDGKGEPLGGGWTPVGFGVEYQRVNTGNAILIAYGGYTAHLSYSAAWASELVDVELGAADVGQIYAVQGPADPGYDGREIGNSKLRAHLATIDDGHSPIYVIAHSSGSYVAIELLSQLHAAGNTNVLGRIMYACLEGGGSGLTTEIVDELRQITFVYAHDPTLSSGYSENTSAEQALGSQYAPHATTFEVVVPSTGCDNDAGWCLHDVVITHRPHDPSSYDLADDYTDFAGRPLTTEYLAPLLPGA
jgi:hypothetical protein